MVKKNSIFTRLKERWSSNSVRIETPRAADAAKPPEKRAEPARVAPARVEPAPTRPPVVEELPSTAFAGEARTTRKLSDKEEALVAIGTHFQELAALMRGSQARMDGQMHELIERITTLTQLPAMQQQQLDVLRGISGHMERQTNLGEQLAQTLSTLPKLLTSVETALQRAAATDERSNQTMRDFQGTMDRIHAAMGRMVEHSETQAQATKQLAEKREESLSSLTTNLEKNQRESAAHLQKATDESMATLRRAHEDQSNRLQRIVQEHAGMNRLMLVGLGLLGLGVIALLVMNLLK